MQVICFVKNQIQEKKGDTAARNAVQLLRHLRLVFCQGLPLIFAKYPHSMIFKWRILSQRWNPFEDSVNWLKSVWENQRILDQAGRPPSIFLKQCEGVGNIILSMQIVPSTFYCPKTFKMRSVPGRKFFSYLERASLDGTVPSTKIAMKYYILK